MRTVKFVCTMAVISLLIQPVMAQTAGTFKINGTIKNMPVASKMAYLYVGKDHMDSCVIKENQYHFTGSIDSLTAMKILLGHIRINEVADMAAVYVDKGDFNIISDGRIDNFSVSGSGSAVEQDYLSATLKTRHTADSLKKIAALPEFKTDKKLVTDWRLAMSNMFKPMNDEFVAYLKANTKSPAGKMMMEYIGALQFSDPDEIDSLLKTLPASTQAAIAPKIMAATAKHRAADQLKKEKEGMTPIGSKAKDFIMANTEGKMISLSSFKGKYLLVDFWASWCGPCRGENPNVVKAYEKYKDKGFNILGVSLDAASTKAAWLKAIQTDKLNWTQVSDLKGWGNEAAKAYGITAIPQNFLIDPNGIIIGKNLRGEELQNKLASLFSK